MSLFVCISSNIYAVTVKKNRSKDRSIREIRTVPIQFCSDIERFQREAMIIWYVATTFFVSVKHLAACETTTLLTNADGEPANTSHVESAINSSSGSPTNVSTVPPLTLPPLLTEEFHYEFENIPNLETLENELHSSFSTREPLFTNLIIATTRWPLNHPVEDSWIVKKPVLVPMYDEQYDIERFAIVDGKLFPILNNGKVYGSMDYIPEFWKVFVPVVLSVLLLCTFSFSYLIITKYSNDSEMNKCSTLLLLCVAFFDIGTIVIALAENVFQYTKMAKNFGTLPFDSCMMKSILGRLSSVPHTISLWLTLLLSLQRYLCVSKPFDAKDTITLRKTIVSTMVLVVIAVAFHLPRFLDVSFRQVAISKDEYPGQVIMTCDIEYKDWIKNVQAYESIYLWTRFILVKFIPCTLMTIFSISMAKVLKRNVNGKFGAKKGLQKTSSTKLSLYIVVVSLVIVVAEIPIGVLSCIYAVSISTGVTFIPFDTLKLIAIIADIVLYVSYCFIYLIYCFMAKKVRAYILNCVSRLIKKSENPNCSHGDSSKSLPSKSKVNVSDKGTKFISSEIPSKGSGRDIS